MMTAPFSQARWIWSAEDGDPHCAVRRFRGTFETTSSQTLTVHVSADSRYLLYLDGRFVGRGPARSDLRHYVYETYTLELSPGRHVLAAIVQAYGGSVAPIAEMHERGAFVLEAQDVVGRVVCATQADGPWRVLRDTAYQPAMVTMRDGYYGIGASEVVEGAQVPPGWEQPDFDDSAWEAPVALLEPYLRERPSDMADPGGRWRLVPRDIPALREEVRQFADAPAFPADRAAEHAAGDHPERR